MMTETASDGEIESIDVATQDLTTILAEVVEYERTAGSVDVPRMVVIGDGGRRMAMPESETSVDSNVVFDATRLVRDGAVVDEIAIRGDDVDVNVV